MELFSTNKLHNHGGRHDTVMYVNQRVKKRDLLNIANYKLLQLGRKLIKSSTTVYNRSRPRNVRSLQAKRHLGNWLFCFEKPPKAEDESNENTHYQRVHINNSKMNFFSLRNEEPKDLCMIESMTLTDVNKAR